MKCEKCESENVKVVAHTTGENKSYGVWYVLLTIFGFIVFAVGVIFLIVARKTLNEGLLSIDMNAAGNLRMKENLTEYNQRFVLGIICCAVGVGDILLLLVIKVVSPSTTRVQIIGVCLDCGETWIIPAKLKEFNETEVYQAKQKRKERNKRESEVEGESKADNAGEEGDEKADSQAK